MDLSVSPDLEAYICYAIVILLGAVTAVVQIHRRLGDLAGAWYLPQTWLLFFLYLLVPVALFWFLDRTSALTDTSLFAALLVGAGYVGIMNGSNQTFRAPGDLSQLWTPFLAYADKVSEIVLKRTAEKRARVVERVVASITGDPARYTALESLAMRFSADQAALRAQLAAIDAPAAARRPHEILEDKARLLLTQLVAVPDAYYLMKERGIIPQDVYWLDVQGLRRLILPILLLIGFVVAAPILWRHLGPDSRTLRADYNIWRLSKTNSTSVDQHRARFNLSELMRDPKVETDATKKLALVLRQPGLPIERIDLILQTLLETRAKTDGNPSLPAVLVQSLRTGSVDTRTRINDVLKHFVEVCGAKFDEGTTPWKPSDGDSTTFLEMRVRRWADFWGKNCPARP